MLYVASEKIETRVLAPNSMTCFNFPETVKCIDGGLNFVWLSAVDSAQSCICPIHNSSTGNRIFGQCIAGCGPDDHFPHFNENGSICFSDLNSTLNETLFHFQCSTEPCTMANSECFIRTILTSHRIIIQGKFIHKNQAHFLWVP